MNERTKYNFNDSDKLFFTSDTHFYHKNIIKFCNRPFASVEEMNETLITNWNNTVDEDSYIFHLGDVLFGGFANAREILPRLNGHKFLIIGNHDMKNMSSAWHENFDIVANQMQLTIGNRSVYLNHYPFLCYGGTYRKNEDVVYQLFGHVHSNPNTEGADDKRLKYLFPFQYDVGVDNNNYRPISWLEVKNKIEQQIKNKNENRSDL